MTGKDKHDASSSSLHHKLPGVSRSRYLFWIGPSFVLRYRSTPIPRLWLYISRAKFARRAIQTPPAHIPIVNNTPQWQTTVIIQLSSYWNQDPIFLDLISPLFRNVYRVSMEALVDLARFAIGLRIHSLFSLSPSIHAPYLQSINGRRNRNLYTKLTISMYSLRRGRFSDTLTAASTTSVIDFRWQICKSLPHSAEPPSTVT